MDLEECQRLLCENNNTNNSKTTNQKKQKTEREIINKYIYPNNPLIIFKSLSNLDKNKITKLSLSFIIILFFSIFNNLIIISNPTPHNIRGKICYEDIIHQLSKPINKLFLNNYFFRKTLGICGSLFLDLLYLLSIFIWAIYAIDWKLIISIIFFFIIRRIIQEIIRMTKPDFLFFPYPGLPSILTNYSPASDYFFSGHCGMPIILAVELKWLNCKGFTFCCIFVSLFEMFYMVSCRGHYSIDIIVGILIAHYITFISENINKKIYNNKFLKKLKEENKNELINIGFDCYNQHKNHLKYNYL